MWWEDSTDSRTMKWIPAEVTLSSTVSQNQWIYVHANASQLLPISATNQLLCVINRQPRRFGHACHWYKSESPGARIYIAFALVRETHFGRILDTRNFATIMVRSFVTERSVRKIRRSLCFRENKSMNIYLT